MTAVTTTVTELVAQLGAGDPLQAFQARQKLNEQIAKLTDPSETAQLSALADLLVAELNARIEPTGPQPRMTNVLDDLGPTTLPKHPVAVRRLLCQLLNPIASDAQVPALAAALTDLEVREAVRGVLDQIPTMVSTVQLVKAFGQIGPEFRVGVVNSLGQGRWREAMVTLIRGVKDADPEIRLTSLEGLANFPEAPNDKLFVEAMQLASPRQVARIQKARVRLAETLRNAGEAAAARAIYQSIENSAPDGPWKKAARIGLAKLQS